MPLSLYLLTLFAKDDQSNLTKGERNELADPEVVIRHALGGDEDFVKRTRGV